jgi:hypothetical protein
VLGVAAAVLVGGALAILWLISLVSVLTNDGRYKNGSQLIWVLVLLLSGPIGAVLYQCLGPLRSPAGLDALAEQERDRQKLLG